MKSSLRHLLALVLAILAGTFVTVRGYLDSLEPRTAHAAPRVGWEGSSRAALAPVDGPGSLLPVDGRVRAYDAAGSEESSVQDDNCPTCALTPRHPAPTPAG